MKAMLLAAGLGRRMLPLTHTLPKPAIPVLGHPLALQILGRLAAHGVREAVLNVHHLPQVVEAMLAGAATRGLPRTHLSHEPTILGTAGGLRQAAPLLRGAGPILVHNADFVSEIDLRAAVAAHRDSGRLATLVLAPPRPGYARVDVDRRGDVLALAGHPRAAAEEVAASYLFTGCHVIEEALLERIPEHVPSGIVADVYRQLAAERRLGSVVHRGFWWEFGDPLRYLEGSLELLALAEDRRAAVARHDPVRRLDHGLAAVGPGVRLAQGVRVDGRAAVGRGVTLARDVQLRDSVLMPEARIGAGSRLERVVVGPATEVPPGFEATDTLIVADPGAAPDLPPQVRRIGGLLLRPLAEDAD